MPKIKVLDEVTACRIAAGEVVERPVSVVKELVENSLDAGADRVTVTLTGGGADAIAVLDNGCGISQEDTPLAFQRHATSKIATSEDLDHIATMGFRGEALPSIAAVSDLQIKTRTAPKDAGYYLRIRGGAIIESGPVGCPVGTAVSVRDLFFNTPARRKHLKTKATEGGLCADLIYKLSLIRPGVRFTLAQQGRTLFRSPGTGKLSDVLAAVYGFEAAEMMLPVHAVEGDLAVTGYVSKPALNRAGRQQITLAVNGRLVRSALVNQTLDEAYKGLMTVGRHPLAVLQIQLPAELIDVNIHPAKTEIKIANELQLARLLVAAVRDALGKTSLIPAARPASGVASPGKTTLPAGAEPLKLVFAPADAPVDASGAAPSARPESAWPGYDVRELAGYVAEAGAELAGEDLAGEEFAGGELAGADDAAPDDAAPDDAAPLGGRSGKAPQPPGATQGPAPAGYPDKPGSAEEQRKEPVLAGYSDKPGSVGYFDQSTFAGEQQGPVSARYPEQPASAAAQQVGCHASFPSLRVVGQLLNMYIICDGGDGAYLIDQHAAHERVLFEQYHARLRNNSPQVQYLLVPLSINLKPHEKELLQEHRQELEALGFVLDDFGRESLLLRAIPSESSPGDAAGLIADLAETILAQGKPDELGVEFALAALLACKAAVKAGEKLALQAMQSLVNQLAVAGEPFTCPHGRPTLVSISKRELHTMFKRT